MKQASQRRPTDIVTQFDRWWHSVDRGGAVSSRVGRVRFRVVTGNRHAFMARITSGGGSRQSIRVQVSLLFLRTYRVSVAAHARALEAACLPSRTQVGLDPTTRSLLIASVRELSESFLILHELFHICCGHVGWQRQRDRALLGMGYDETWIGMSAGRMRRQAPYEAPESELNPGYYREIEADNSALQWLMRGPMPASLRALCRRQARDGSPDDSILNLDGEVRCAAFRALLSAVWLMTVALEQGRNRAGKDYPYPAARLIASASTVLEQFAELTATRIDRAGYRTQRLDGEQAEQSRRFFHEVARYVFKAPWGESPDVAGALRGELFPPSVVLDMGNLMFGRKPTTAAGKQLAKLQGIRRSERRKYGRFQCLPIER